MSDTRDSISKLIAELQRTESMWDQLKPTTFERVVAELASQDSAFVGLRRVSEAVDLMVKMHDNLGVPRTVALEIKRFTQPVGLETVEKFQKSIERLNIDKGFLITDSFTETARRAAEQYERLQLIDRSGLRSWVDDYLSKQGVFVSSLFSKVRDLSVEPKVDLSEPSADEVEAIDPANTDLGADQRAALIRAESLPLRVIARILRAPHEVRDLSPRQFEEFIAEMLSQLGFTNVILTPRSRDGGKDVIASNSINGIPLSFYFECKQYAGGNKVQLETLRALLGTMAHDARAVSKGVLVTTSTFTKGAREFLLAEARLDGKDYNGLLGWIDEVRKKFGDGSS